MIMIVQHMKNMPIDPGEAVRIHQDIKPRYSIGVQWGKFCTEFMENEF